MIEVLSHSLTAKTNATSDALLLLLLVQGGEDDSDSFGSCWTHLKIALRRSNHLAQCGASYTHHRHASDLEVARPIQSLVSSVALGWEPSPPGKGEDSVPFSSIDGYNAVQACENPVDETT